MKKATMLGILSLMFCFNAYGTKARVESLQGATHLVDTQSIFTYTADMHQLGQYMALEFGPTADGITEPKAEGALFRKASNGALYGVYLGHHDETLAAIRANQGFDDQSNPVQGFYGRDHWAVTLGLSNSEDKNADTKETTVSLGYGQNFSDYSWGVNGQLMSQAEQGDDEFKGGPMVNANFRQHGKTYWHGALSYGMMSSEVGGVDTDIKPMGVAVGWVDRTLGSETTDLYYGLALEYADITFEDDHLKAMSLPVSAGLEHPLNSWAVFRASISQNVLLGSTKDETAGAGSDEEQSIENNTTVAAGLGLKYGGITLDGTLTGATTGNINGNSILARAGMIYNF